MFFSHALQSGSRSAVRIAVCVVLSLALVASACGGGGDEPAQVPVPTSEPTEVAPSPDPAEPPQTPLATATEDPTSEPADPLTPTPDPAATPDSTGGDTTPTAEPTPDAPPVPTPSLEADAPNPVRCDAEQGELPYDGDGDGTADACKNPDTGVEATPVATPAPTAAPTPVATPVATAAPTVRPTPAPERTPAEALAAAVANLPAVLAEAERSGTWIVSLSDVDAFTWDADNGLRVVVLRIPVDDPGFRPLLDNAGVERDISLEDTAENRRWVQECMRADATFESAREQTVAILTGASDAPTQGSADEWLSYYASSTLGTARSCLSGIGRFEQLQARYWWTDDGLACASRQSMLTAQEGDRVKRAQEVCPTIAHDPSSVPAWPALDPDWGALYADGPPAGMDWVMARCQEIVAAYPHPDPAVQAAYSADPAGSYDSRAGDVLPSCWDDDVAGVTISATRRADEGAGGGPFSGLGYVAAHECYHGFFGYVWARQTERESRGPNELGFDTCVYYAYRAVP